MDTNFIVDKFMNITINDNMHSNSNINYNYNNNYYCNQK